MSESVEKYKLLTEIIPDIVYEFDKEGRFSFISDAVRELGYSPDELIGKHFKEIVHPDDVKSLEMFRTANKGMPRCFEIKLLLKDPIDVLTGYRYAEVHFCTRQRKDSGEDKNYIGSIGIIKDITKYKRVEEALENVRNDIRKSYEGIIQSERLSVAGELASGFAHEISQPLNGIVLIATHIRKLSERNSINQDYLKESLNEIDGLAKRMKRVVEHIRTFTRQGVPNFENVQIIDTINTVLSLFNEQLRPHQIEVELRIEGNLPNVSAEPYQLQQVWINLISNAKDALNEKGHGYKKKVEITATYDKDIQMVLVSFADNGIGVKEEHKKKVFEPFFTTKEVEKYPGLGLSISYGIIENHKGKIEFKSTYGEGTKVKVSLPVSGYSGVK